MIPEMAWQADDPQKFLQMRTKLRDDVLQLERSHCIWPRIVGHLNIDHESMLAPKEMTTSGPLFRHLESIVHRFKDEEKWTKYKFGVTIDPVHRWDEVGDYRTQYHKMRLLLCTTSKKESDSLEAYLIRVFQYEQCQNKKPGGEGPKREAPPHFTYVVTTSRPNEGRRISAAGA